MKQVKKNIVILFVETGTREPKPRFGTREELDGNERTETYKNFRNERDLQRTILASRTGRIIFVEWEYKRMQSFPYKRLELNGIFFNISSYFVPISSALSPVFQVLMIETMMGMLNGLFFNISTTAAFSNAIFSFFDGRGWSSESSIVTSDRVSEWVSDSVSHLVVLIQSSRQIRY